MLAVRDWAKQPGRGVVLALPDSPLATATAERLRESGWQVYRAATAEEARRLVGRYAPEAVVLPAEGGGESGWLTCAKLLRARPRLRVVLVGERSVAGPRLARFVGATGLVPPSAGADELAARVTGATLQLI
jgi:DNA-binding response OmpR family regulator